MPKICSSCNREIEGKRRDHVCNVVELSDGRIVNADRVDRSDGDVRQEIEAGKVKVAFRVKNQPLKRLFGTERRNQGEDRQASPDPPASSSS